MYPQLLILLLNLEVPTDSSKLPRKLKQQLRRFPLDGWSQVKEMARPGCPQKMLKVALDSISSLSRTLTFMSSSSAHNKFLLAYL